MNKLMILQGALLAEIEKYAKIHAENSIELDYPIDWERIHVISCAKLGYLMAEERGVDSILAAAACAVHDYGRIITGKQANHAEVGYEPVKEFLAGLEIFTEDEIEQIALAVRNHSDKAVIGSPLEEIVKDADVLDFHQYGYEMPRKEQQDRLDKLLEGRAAALRFSEA
jgi:uncharacterized protein